MTFIILSNIHSCHRPSGISTATIFFDGNNHLAFQELARSTQNALVLRFCVSYSPFIYSKMYISYLMLKTLNISALLNRDIGCKKDPDRPSISS
jgi:hypothetical protein